MNATANSIELTTTGFGGDEFISVDVLSGGNLSNILEALKTGLTSAKSVIGDTDYAVATSALNRQNVLLTTGISLLGLANQQTAQVLSLLG